MAAFSTCNPMPSGEAVCIAFNHLTVICSSQQSRSDIYPQLWPSEIDERIPTRLLQDPISSKPFQPSAQIPSTSVEGTDNTPPTQRHTWSCHMATGMRSPASSGCPALPWEPGVPLAGEAWPPKPGGLLRGELWCRACMDEAVRPTAWDMPASSSACGWVRVYVLGCGVQDIGFNATLPAAQPGTVKVPGAERLAGQGRAAAHVQPRCP